MRTAAGDASPIAVLFPTLSSYPRSHFFGAQPRSAIIDANPRLAAVGSKDGEAADAKALASAGQ